MAVNSPFGYSLMTYHSDYSTPAPLNSIAYIHINETEFDPHHMIGRPNGFGYALVHRQVPAVDVEAVSNFFNQRTRSAYGMGQIARKVWNFIKEIKLIKMIKAIGKDEEIEITRDDRLELIQQCSDAADAHEQNMDNFLKAERQDLDCLQDNIPTPIEALEEFVHMRVFPCATMDSYSIHNARGSLSSMGAEYARKQNTPSLCPVQRDANPLDPGRISPSAGRGMHQCSPELAARIVAAIEAEQTERRLREACDPHNIQYFKRHQELTAQIKAEQQAFAKQKALAEQNDRGKHDLPEAEARSNSSLTKQ